MKPAALIVCLGLGLTVGPATQSVSASQAPLSFASRTGVVAVNNSKASVLVDRANGTFLRVKRRPVGNTPRIAVADAIGDLNGDGKPDLVTHYNSSEDGEGITIDGVTIYPAYGYVNLSRKNGTFRGVHIVYENDYADIASLAIGDVSGDGKPDVEIGSVDEDGDGAVTILLGRGKGKFQRVKHSLRTGPSPVAIAAVDVNADHRRDLVTANAGGTVSVLVNLGGGRFAPRRTFRVGPDPTALAIGDLNGDRHPDLVVARSGGGVHAVTVLFNRGHGSFGGRHDYQTGNGPVSVAIGDVNGDRRPDLVTANNYADTASVLLNEGRGTFRAKLDYVTGHFPIAVAIGNLHASGRRDLVIPTFNGNPKEAVSVLVNTPGLCDVQDVWGLPLASATQRLASSGCGVGSIGHAPSTGFAAGRVISQTPESGTVLKGGKVDLTVSDGPGPGKLAATPLFSSAKSYSIPKGGQAVAIADLNGDGTADVVTGNCGNTVSVLLNDGRGTLAPRQDYRVHDCPDTLALADLNGDGRPDIVTGGDSGIVSVLLNRGDGTFAARRDYETDADPLFGTNYLAVGDLNGDGRPDLATANGCLSTFLNNGDGTFGARRDYTYSGCGGAEALALTDLNGDGTADVVMTDGYAVDVVLNRGGGNFEQAQRAWVAPADASDIFVGDLTGDDKPDVVVTNSEWDAVQVLLDNGAGKLRPYVDYRAATDLAWVAIADLNGDGTEDVVTAGRSVSLLRNRGDGTFTARRDYATGLKPPRAVAVGDLNGDGKPDLVTANGTTVVVLLNR